MSDNWLKNQMKKLNKPDEMPEWMRRSSGANAARYSPYRNNTMTADTNTPPVIGKTPNNPLNSEVTPRPWRIERAFLEPSIFIGEFRVSTQDVERFESKFSKGEVCWEWHAYTATNGYGRFDIGSKKRSSIAAHRFSYLVYNGEIGDDKLVCHSCDNRLCVNPDHLWLGSYKENTQDMMRKGRNKYLDRSGTHRKRPHLTKDEVIEIRRLRQDGVIREEVANKFNISKAHVDSIVRRDVWKEIIEDKDYHLQSIIEKLQQENQRLKEAYDAKCEELDLCCKPCFSAVVGYVQKHGAKWDVKYLGKTCHDVIIDRCETLQQENQRLQSIIDKHEEPINTEESINILEVYKDSVLYHISENKRMQAIIDKQREAVEFYANEDNYDVEYAPYRWTKSEYHGGDVMDYDMGGKAREALALTANEEIDNDK